MSSMNWARHFFEMSWLLYALRVSWRTLFSILRASLDLVRAVAIGLFVLAPSCSRRMSSHATPKAVVICCVGVEPGPLSLQVRPPAPSPAAPAKRVLSPARGDFRLHGEP